MNMSEMLDVLHYYMESDFNVSSAEQAEARDKARSIIYKSLYDKEYKSNHSGRRDYQATASSYNESFPDTDPSEGLTKSYVPPTDFNLNSEKPFGEILDSPLSS